MRAIHINATDKTVTEIDHAGGFEDIRDLLGIQYIEGVYIIPRHVMYIDEEGKLHGQHNHGFAYAGFPDVMHGSAIIFGMGGEDEAPATVSLETIKRHIAWVDIDNEAKTYKLAGRAA